MAGESPSPNLSEPTMVDTIVSDMPERASTASISVLADVHESAKLRPYLSDLWSRRSYITYVSASELRSRQVTTVLGNLWHLLNPALTIAVYYIIFGLLLQTTRGVDNFLLFLTVGIFIFSFTQRATISGAKSIVSNAGLIKSIKFPRALLPVTSTLTETLASLPSFAVLYAVALFTGEAPHWRWLLLPGIIALQMVFNLGAGFVAARATTHFRDTTQILPFVFRLLLYASGVIFSAEAYADSRWWFLFVLNPMYCFISLGRWSMLGDPTAGSVLVSALVWTAGAVIIGFFWFRAAEERYARD
jgi:teichoic acid transport system permease protein